MEEQQVTVDGNTYQLANPFFVVATQNPADMDGTHPLPEAQRDRFTTRISLGYPDPAAELAMIGEHAQVNPLASLRPVTSVTQISQLIAAVGQVHVAPEVQKYAVDLVSATRSVPEVRLGASPRATLHLIRAAKAQAALSGRGFVTPDDIQQLVVPVLAHRIVFASTYGTGHHQQQATALLSTLLSRVPVPTNGTR
jgi:MoxR-like ATPase